jgi:hypothetical protein
VGALVEPAARTSVVGWVSAGRPLAWALTSTAGAHHVLWNAPTAIHTRRAAIYADWTTTPEEWALYQAAWVHPGRERR